MADETDAATLEDRVARLEQAVQSLADIIEDTLADRGDVSGVERAGIELATVRKMVGGG